MPLLFCVPNDSFCVLRIQSVHDIEKVSSIELSALREAVWKEHHELRFLLHHWKKVLEGELVVERNVDGLHLVHSKQGLLLHQNIL